jgi:hypothetical protein
MGKYGNPSDGHAFVLVILTVAVAGWIITADLRKKKAHCRHGSSCSPSPRRPPISLSLQLYHLALRVCNLFFLHKHENEHSDTLFFFLIVMGNRERRCRRSLPSFLFWPIGRSTFLFFFAGTVAVERCSHRHRSGWPPACPFKRPKGPRTTLKRRKRIFRWN